MNEETRTTSEFASANGLLDKRVLENAELINRLRVITSKLGELKERDRPEKSGMPPNIIPAEPTRLYNLSDISNHLSVNNEEFGVLIQNLERMV